MHWSEIEKSQPRLGQLGRQRLIEPGVVLVATIRRDGTPRLSPVEPFIMDSVLWLSMTWQSTKARDLLRDPRIPVHSVITSRDATEGEFKVRGTARAEADLELQAPAPRKRGGVSAAWACPLSMTPPWTPSASLNRRRRGTFHPGAPASGAACHAW
jgi:hypothetical protein